MFDDWYLIKKPFRGSELYITGNPIDASTWRNTESLEEAGYIRKPISEEDHEKIKKAINLQAEREELENNSSPSREPIGRGRPKKNRGD